MYAFMDLIFIVFGILNLILFFKVWGMCNDVRKIRINYENKIQSEKDIALSKKKKNQEEPLNIGDEVFIIKTWKKTVVTARSNGKYECSSNNGNFYDGTFSRNELCKCD